MRLSDYVTHEAYIEFRRCPTALEIEICRDELLAFCRPDLPALFILLNSHFDWSVDKCKIFSVFRFIRQPAFYSSLKSKEAANLALLFVKLH